MNLKSVITATTLAITIISCKKDPVHPIPVPEPPVAVDYIDLGNKEIKQKNPAIFIDFNKDGRIDVRFGTLLVGDPIFQQDKLLFLAGTDIETRLAVNANEQSPVLDQSDNIPISNFNGYNWYEAASVELVQKVTSINAPVFWQGNWQTATHKYLPVQVIKGQQRFNGWVELTVDIANEKLVLHRAAISKVGERSIKAG